MLTSDGSKISWRLAKQTIAYSSSNHLEILGRRHQQFCMKIMQHALLNSRKDTSKDIEPQHWNALTQRAQVMQLSEGDNTRCTLFPLVMVLSHWVFLTRFLMRQHFLSVLTIWTSKRECYELYVNVHIAHNRPKTHVKLLGFCPNICVYILFVNLLINDQLENTFHSLNSCS